MQDEQDLLIVGEFNLMRGPENRNKPGGDITELLFFNEAISSLGLLEIPLLGKQFTWSNKQQPPLLERIDWFLLPSLGLKGGDPPHVLVLLPCYDFTPFLLSRVPAIDIFTPIPKQQFLWLKSLITHSI